MDIVWKPVVGYEGIYEVSNVGEIRSIKRLVWNGKGYKTQEGKLLKVVLNHKGYPCVYLSKNAKDTYSSIHRLVAKAFIPNPENKPQVNHINGIKTDNRVENLEWCTNVENQKHAWRMGLQKVSGKAGKPKRKVLQINPKTGEIIQMYLSISEAAKAVGVKQSSNIGYCCRGAYGHRTIAGFKWEYFNEEVM